MPRTKQRTPELRERLLRTAIEAIEADGLGGLTIRRVAGDAQTSPPALYELFGDRAGLVGEIFSAGFRRLADRLEATSESDDPLADLRECLLAFDDFARANPALAAVMFSRPFADFEAGRAELAAARAAHDLIVRRVRRCLDAGLLAGDAIDISHVLFVLARGLAVQEASGLLGRTAAERKRRRDLAFDAALAGLAARDRPGSRTTSAGQRSRTA